MGECKCGKDLQELFTENNWSGIRCGGCGKRWQPKPTWEQATKENLVVIKQFLQAENGLPARDLMQLQPEEYEGQEIIIFVDINGCRMESAPTAFKIQPAQSPPALEG